MAARKRNSLFTGSLLLTKANSYAVIKMND